jgi:hypothetical protein
MTKTPEAIWLEACEAAQTASNASEAKQTSWYPCGFSWFNIRPARGKMVSYLKSIGVGSTDSYAGGYRVSSYDMSNQSPNWSQSLQVKSDATIAGVAVLQANGVNAISDSRWD